MLANIVCELINMVIKHEIERHYGFFRSVINEVVREYLKCGDMKEGRSLGFIDARSIC